MSCLFLTLSLARAAGHPAPAPASGFLARPSAPPLPLRGTAAANLAFVEYARGSFRAWYVRRVPEERAEALWRLLADLARPQGLVALLEDDKEFAGEYYEQFINEDGTVTAAPLPSLTQALAVQARRLGVRAAGMRAALAQAIPTSGSRAAEPTRTTMGLPPRPFRALLLIAASVETIAQWCTSGDNFAPQPDGLAVVLHAWQARYEATLKACSGDHVTLAVRRPPQGLAALRELAWQFYLMCPGHPSGFTATNEPAPELLARLRAPTWTCSWFVE